MAKARYWIGDAPTKCDMSDALSDHDNMDTFIDGRIHGGSWANMCLKCHAAVGVGLGMGRGQKYTKQEDGRWLKVAG